MSTTATTTAAVPTTPVPARITPMRMTAAVATITSPMAPVVRISVGQIKREIKVAVIPVIVLSRPSPRLHPHPRHRRRVRPAPVFRRRRHPPNRLIGNPASRIENLAANAFDMPHHRARNGSTVFCVQIRELEQNMPVCVDLCAAHADDDRARRGHHKPAPERHLTPHSLGVGNTGPPRQCFGHARQRKFHRAPRICPRLLHEPPHGIYGNAQCK